MLKLFGRRNALNVQKVMWFVGELALQLERVDRGGPFGGNRDPEYLALNPNGTVPTLVDGDFVLWESNAVVRYLGESYGGPPWVPDDRHGRALAGQWMDWSNAVIIRRIAPLIEGLREPAARRDAAAIAAHRDRVAEAWTVLDDHLADRDYILGAAPTIADVALGAVVNRWYVLPIERPARPRLERWYGRLRERPAYRHHVLFEDRLVDS
ncbi:MAG TPA: glutathione S-transferase family protein [Rhodospirillales bacterium]|jgi:glutathione S-transferase|nr:glutathione S-transferase family protein [Rhodospirillales bacterium]